MRQKGRKTSKKSRVIASHQQVVRFDSESKDEINETSSLSLLRACEAYLPHVDAILLSDYGKGVLTTAFTCKVIALAKKYQKLILVDPKGDDYSKYRGATLITPNKKRRALQQR